MRDWVPTPGHTVEVGSAAAREVNIPNGFSRQLVPGPGQCFVRFDVTRSHYGGGHEPPKVAGRHFDGAPFELSMHEYFSPNGLPREIDHNASAYLVLQAPCAAEKLTDAQLVEEVFQ